MAADKSRHIKAVSAVMGNLRRAPRRVRLHGRDVVDTAVAQLFEALAAPPVDDPGGGQYRMEELARLAGTTTRNIRLYRDRGLLAPPQRIGRLAIYSDGHLSRLRLISELLQRGYTISNIRELLNAYTDGKSVAEVLGLPGPSVAHAAWAPERPRTLTLSQAQDLIADPPAFERLIALGLIVVNGATVTLMRPKLVDALNEIRAHGVALDRLLDIHEQVLPHIAQISDVLVNAGAQYAAGVLSPAGQPTNDAEFAELVSALITFAPLAVSSINGTLTASIQAVAQAVVGTMLSDFVHRSERQPADQHESTASDGGRTG